MEVDMARRYFAGVIHSDDGKTYGIHFPDLPGCTSAGDGLADCLANAEEALNLYIESLAEDNLPIPEPSDLAKVTEAARNDEDGNSVVTVQFVPAVLPTKAVRLSISMDEELIKRIDAAAGHYGRSGWLAEAAREKLAGAARQ
jgi:predicted RNase H-like HicB family nuclease